MSRAVLWVRLICLLGSLSVLGGCATLMSRFFGPDAPRVYGGVRTTCSWLKSDFSGGGQSSNIGLLLIFDLPASLALDTLLLPLTLWEDAQANARLDGVRECGYSSR
ncbi:MAG: YceK/YidQ family lipoprotein [Planctomycetes bacterium]|nr:YceK/YidQ family lipoprotein [Planctomycetota bacterium]